MKRHEQTEKQVNVAIQLHRDCINGLKGNVILKEHKSTRGKLTAHLVQVYNKDNKEWLTGAMVVSHYWEVPEGVLTKNYPMTVVRTAVRGTLSAMDVERLWEQLTTEMAILDAK